MMVQQVGLAELSLPRLLIQLLFLKVLKKSAMELFTVVKYQRLSFPRALKGLGTTLLVNVLISNLLYFQTTYLK